MEDDYPKVYLYRRVVQAKTYIDFYYMESPDLTNIADEAAFSKFHFLRLFKRIVGSTPHQYLNKVRLSHAQRLLKQGFAVSEACVAVGFESSSSFSGLFKRTFGQTPQSFQALELARNQAIHEAPLKFIPHCFAESKGWLGKAILEK